MGFIYKVVHMPRETLTADPIVQGTWLEGHSAGEPAGDVKTIVSHQTLATWLEPCKLSDVVLAACLLSLFYHGVYTMPAGKDLLTIKV
jgi:hypothetical protein